MSKKLTESQMAEQAKILGIEPAALQAVIDVECKGSGFNQDGTPVILYERHVMRQRLIANNKVKIADEMMRKRPDLCSKTSGGYGLYSQQHAKLNDAAKFDRTSALESCSWGIGQVMGYHWYSLGYPSLQAFINAMYKDEASQLEAMCRFIKVNGLVNALKNKDWKAFARGYNGPAYAKNNYDVKLGNAYKLHSSHY
ncbi:N-acetylmuramidase family protein [Acinetobacter baumannii]|uniref:N-acetylmuramidase family protein n=1 Tax=Acinetobacter baumannii TaxID=470 RepID=UPI00233FD78F|nr:N-acetylmuramidase family protein [Acinetobacter baumannii]MDC4773757.1 N-acetylmuramidase family protein [Acinetobacter baumannii]MDV4325438.1 N-acetylmuramidase family protein [Acinetobacter baumannii]